MPEIVNLQGEHWTITAVTLNAFTDDIDTPVHRNEYHLFRGMVAEKITGSIFFLENEHSGDAWVILADSPDYERAELVVRDYRAAVKTSGNVTVVSCKKGECEQVCRKTLGAEMFPGTPVTMSNTWGDGNGFRRVCEESLPTYWIPKVYMAVDELPMTGTGKPDRATARRLASL